MSTFALLAHTSANTIPGGSLSAATADNMFAKGTLNVVLTDSSTMIGSFTSSQFTFSATGNYQIQGTVGFGYSSGQDGGSFRCGLYNVSSSAFVTQAGGAVEIISESGQGGDLGAGTACLYVDLNGRFTVSSTSNIYAIYCAGDVLTGTWFSSTFAQGAPSTLVTTGTKPECYKQIALIKE